MEEDGTHPDGCSRCRSLTFSSEWFKVERIAYAKFGDEAGLEAERRRRVEARLGGKAAKRKKEQQQEEQEQRQLLRVKGKLQQLKEQEEHAPEDTVNQDTGAVVRKYRQDGATVEVEQI